MRIILFPLLFILLGAVTILGGLWLIWDWAISLSYYIDWSRFFKEWFFHLPFKVYMFKPSSWTVPFDLGMALVILGLVILISGIYMLSRYLCNLYCPTARF